MGFPARIGINVRHATIRLVNSDALVTADPTDTKVLNGPVVQVATWIVAQSLALSIPLSQMREATLDLKWATKMGSGTGASKWLVMPGVAPPGSTVIGGVDVTSEEDAGLTEDVHRLSGPVRWSALEGEGPWSLVLAVKADEEGDKLTSWVYDSSTIFVGFIA